ncbi:FecR family protein [Chitinophaga varians]|uniref:FecR family protein n=1 Tax=Chitinophaga varians TaxID=2202339 RepID=UPI00165F731B|nr:FecR domain-containing protein [Chitinophaga varians]MBC9914301.1 FecR domain-containing protein [Chitinophaga varians]
MGKADSYLLQKFLEGRCTNEELRQARLLLDTDEGRALLDELMRRREMMVWDNPPEENAAMQPLWRQKQQEMQQRITAYEAGKVTEKKPVVSWRKVLRYAAIWTGLIMLSGLAVWKFGKSRRPVHYVEMDNPKGVPQRHVLPDSTVVYLAAGSRMKYPDSYPQTGRDIELSGEAFFDVVRDDAHPFSIRSGTLLTRVLGTAFRVTAYEGQAQEVAVASGKVAISALRKEKATELAQLTAGRKITWQPATGEVTQSAADISSIEQWKAGDLVFADLPMEQVAQALERRYGVAFRFEKNAIAKHVVSGTFSATDSLPGVLDMLGFVGKFSYRLTADGKTCMIK